MIVTDPYPTLYIVSRPVENSEFKDVCSLARKALACLKKTKYGVGLAANQVGDTRRWFVSQFFKIVVNPEIVEASEITETQEEGCLSNPGYKSNVIRPATIRVRWTSEKGVTINRQLRGLEARVFQHEVDHLNGKNIWD
jgi:peptide deformylase